MTELNNRTTAQYTHTLTVSGRSEGLYQCTVQNNKPSEASAEILVQGWWITCTYTLLQYYVGINPSLIAADTPSEITVTRSGMYSVLISWNSSSRTTGYIIFYQQDGEQHSLVTNTTSANITELTLLGTTYTFTIVATSNISLPSLESDPVVFVLGKQIRRYL